MTQDQETLARTRDFVHAQVVPYVARGDHGLESSRRLHQAAGQAGLLGLQVPRAHGGLEVSFRCKAQVADALAAVDFGVAMSLINTHNVAEQLVRLGKPALAQRHLADLMAGRLIACTAMGVNVNRVSLVVFAISSALGVSAGALIGSLLAIAPGVGESLAVKGFAVLILGGLGSIPGAIVGGLILGVSEAMAAGFISSAYKDVIAFLVMIVVLLFRPEGLLGKR